LLYLSACLSACVAGLAFGCRRDVAPFRVKADPRMQPSCRAVLFVLLSASLFF
jgi:hypothetical protein